MLFLPTHMFIQSHAPDFPHEPVNNSIGRNPILWKNASVESPFSNYRPWHRWRLNVMAFDDCVLQLLRCCRAFDDSFFPYGPYLLSSCCIDSGDTGGIGTLCFTLTAPLKISMLLGEATYNWPMERYVMYISQICLSPSCLPARQRDSSHE